MYLASRHSARVTPWKLNIQSISQLQYCQMHLCCNYFHGNSIMNLGFNVFFFQGDVWAESRVLGFLWHYYACMEGKVYDITEWASCQVCNLTHYISKLCTITVEKNMVAIVFRGNIYIRQRRTSKKKKVLFTLTQWDQTLTLQ